MKTADISVTYLFQLNPEEVGISEDCTDEEFENGIKGYLHRIFEEVYRAAEIIPNDIEIFIGQGEN